MPRLLLRRLRVAPVRGEGARHGQLAWAGTGSPPACPRGPTHCGDGHSPRYQPGASVSPTAAAGLPRRDCGCALGLACAPLLAQGPLAWKLLARRHAEAAAASAVAADGSPAPDRRSSCCRRAAMPRPPQMLVPVVGHQLLKCRRDAMSGWAKAASLRLGVFSPNRLRQAGLRGRAKQPADASQRPIRPRVVPVLARPRDRALHRPRNSGASPPTPPHPAAERRGRRDPGRLPGCDKQPTTPRPLRLPSCTSRLLRLCKPHPVPSRHHCQASSYQGASETLPEAVCPPASSRSRPFLSSPSVPSPPCSTKCCYA
mmetsp:Transcript_8085/g.17535  ORF Transcript_8085/g.17535 Transcript_8085/m.17535 type:complete len:314 (+) Transcript_8085:430-1371(+)